MTAFLNSAAEVSGTLITVVRFNTVILPVKDHAYPETQNLML